MSIESPANTVSVEVVSFDDVKAVRFRDPGLAVYDLDKQISLLESQADGLDYVVAACSGLLCGALDVLWVGEFDLERGRKLSGEAVDGLVTKVARLVGFEGDDLSGAVRFLEKLAPVPSDANTPDFGGGLQHHLRDFAHHPTIAGLAFSVLSQFTGKAYGADTAGRFLIVDVPEKALGLVGDTVPEKLLFGTVRWFLHLASDMAGSSSTAGLGGGTGIPGPVLSLAKELAATPLFKNVSAGNVPLSELLSKLFNGTLLAQHDESGRIVKGTELRLDLRGELGVLAELGRQALPVIANECIVRGFYFLRRFARQVSLAKSKAIGDLRRISWEDVRPFGNPTVDRMVAVAAGVFTTVDVAGAAATEKFWVSVNYVGVCRFALAVGKDVAWCLRARNLRAVKSAYETIRRNTHMADDDAIYDRIGDGLDLGKFGLSVKQVAILYNVERRKVLNDIERKYPIGKFDQVIALKRRWLGQWCATMEENFPSFVSDEGAVLRWLSAEELDRAIAEEGADGTWLRLVVLEAMLFEPYFALSPEEEKGGIAQQVGRLAGLDHPLAGYSERAGDEWLSEAVADRFIEKGYVRRLRKCHARVTRQLNEVLKGALIAVGVTAASAIAVIVTAGVAAPAIATALVGSNFAGLSGAALASACLAYLGGGAVAAGGLGMMGGAAAIVGGGAVLGLGAGGAIGGAVGAMSVLSKRNAVQQSAKLLVAVEEIFLNDERDIGLSQSVIDRYVTVVSESQRDIKLMELRADAAQGDEKKQLERECKEARAAADAMERALKHLRRFSSSFEEGLSAEDDSEAGRA